MPNFLDTRACSSWNLQSLLVLSETWGYNQVQSINCWEATVDRDFLHHFGIISCVKPHYFRSTFRSVLCSAFRLSQLPLATSCRSFCIKTLKIGILRKWNDLVRNGTTPEELNHANSWKSHWKVQFSSILSSACSNTIQHSECVGLTKSIEWFTVSCWATLGKELTVLYAAHSSDHTVPGATYCCITGSSVVAERPWYCTNNAQHWCGWCVNHSKYPVWICWASTMMVLWRRSSYACTTGKMKLHTYY